MQEVEYIPAFEVPELPVFLQGQSLQILYKYRWVIPLIKIVIELIIPCFHTLLNFMIN